MAMPDETMKKTVDMAHGLPTNREKDLRFRRCLEVILQSDETLIVQYRLAGFWGDEREIECRDEFAFACNDQLQARGLGSFDGSDTGGGASNVFFVGIPPDRVGDALQVIVTEIKRCHLVQNVVIARSILIPNEPDPDIEHIVVWPPDFVGDFDILKWSGPNK
jgi:hypothetical protein